MEAVLEFFKWLLANYAQVLAALNGVLAALIAFFLLIPSEQPEKFLQSVLDFLSKFSKK